MGIERRGMALHFAAIEHAVSRAPCRPAGLWTQPRIWRFNAGANERYCGAAGAENAVWLGWSMGGLVASDIALRYPERVAALVTVSSSPCFTAQGEWPGIKSEVLSGFQRQLSEDFKRTVERFLALQTLGTESARQDARILKDVVLTQPMPSVEVLNGGLDILRSVDLREQMAGLKMPLLRIYGYLDGLVPRKVATLLDESCPNSKSVVIQKSAHAPFVSHPGELCGVVESWVQEVGKV